MATLLIKIVEILVSVLCVVTDISLFKTKYALIISCLIQEKCSNQIKKHVKLVFVGNHIREDKTFLI